MQSRTGCWQAPPVSSGSSYSEDGHASQSQGRLTFTYWQSPADHSYSLSITEWKPVTGSLPPMSEAEWASEFLKYQSSPEFRLLNSRMTLEEFKSIYWMEWIHRIWGRAVGLTFVLPAAYFILRGRVSKPMALRLGGIAGLIGFQGFIGWWMVKSGLKDDLFAPGSHPRVSQYRLTSHLGTAFLCYLAMLWNGLTILHTNRFLALPASTAASHLQSLSRPHLRTLKTTSLALTALLFTTALSGALVAGLDAGLIYNEFPYMGVGLTPPTRELLDPFYSHTPPPHPDLLWRNMLENPSTVQLDHRILATSSFTSVMALWAYTRYSPAVRKAMTPPMKRGVHGLVGFVWLQVILGISTLIYLVPLPLASAHQAGALALLSMAVVFDRRLYVPRAAVRAWERRGRTAAGLERGTRGMAGLGGGGGGQIGGAGVVQNRGFASGSMRLARSADVRVV